MTVLYIPVVTCENVKERRRRKVALPPGAPVEYETVDVRCKAKIRGEVGESVASLLKRRGWTFDTPKWFRDRHGNGVRRIHQCSKHETGQ